MKKLLTKLTEFFKDDITGKFSLGRLESFLLVLSGIVGFFLSFHLVYIGKDISTLNYGIGILLSAGTGIRITQTVISKFTNNKSDDTKQNG